MIRKSNGYGRRVLNFPAVHPSDDVSLPTLLSSLTTLSHSICTFTSKCRSLFPCNKRNATTCVRFVEVLLGFFEDIRDQHWNLPGSVVLPLLELHFLLEDSSREGARLWMLMELGRVAAMFRVGGQALDVFPLSSVDGVSVEAKEQVELVMRQAWKPRFEVEVDDERAMMRVVSILNKFEKPVVPISEGDLRWVLEYIVSPSLMGSLYSQLSEGTSRSSKEASALIRTLHDFDERRSSGFKTSSALPQEQFIHVW